VKHISQKAFFKHALSLYINSVTLSLRVLIVTVLS